MKENYMILYRYGGDPKHGKQSFNIELHYKSESSAVRRLKGLQNLKKVVGNTMLIGYRLLKYPADEVFYRLKCDDYIRYIENGELLRETPSMIYAMNKHGIIDLADYDIMGNNISEGDNEYIENNKDGIHKPVNSLLVRNYRPGDSSAAGWR